MQKEVVTMSRNSTTCS